MNRRGFLKALGLGAAAAATAPHLPAIAPALTTAPALSGRPWERNEIVLIMEDWQLPVRKVGTFIPVTRELLDDGSLYVPDLTPYLTNRS